MFQNKNNFDTKISIYQEHIPEEGRLDAVGLNVL
jgi:hypothetical protein